jgi:hypothetical protein
MALLEGLSPIATERLAAASPRQWAAALSPILTIKSAKGMLQPLTAEEATTPALAPQPPRRPAPAQDQDQVEGPARVHSW